MCVFFFYLSRHGKLVPAAIDTKTRTRRRRYITLARFTNVFGPHVLFLFFYVSKCFNRIVLRFVIVVKKKIGLSSGGVAYTLKCGCLGGRKSLVGWRKFD